MSGPLLPLLTALIRHDGPIGVDRFMALALGHPIYGYYTTRDPLGAAGDFTTAPEISQMFGEMIGLWAAEVHASLGAPDPLVLVELGPGRGTLLVDTLRAARAAPAFRAALRVHLVETSPILRARQAQTLEAAGIVPHWHDRLETVPSGPAIVLANEFFDALPVRQFVRATRGWHERLVGLDEAGRLAFGLAPEPDAALVLEGPPGALLEFGFEGQALMGSLARRLVQQGGVALVVDYGYRAPRFGASLQAVSRHATASPLEAPGEADLTAHVDFAGLRRAAEREGAHVLGPVEQGIFLAALGIAARAEALSRARPDQADMVAAALLRLTGPDPQMGTLFKALAVTAPGVPPPPGF